MASLLAAVALAASAAASPDLQLITSPDAPFAIQVGGSAIHQTSNAPQGLTLIPLGSGPALACLWSELDADGNTTPMFAFSRDGQHWSRAMERPSPRLPLRWQEFDPVFAPEPKSELSPALQPALPAVLTARPGRQTFIVQFEVPPFDELARDLAACGAVIRAALPPSSWLIQLDEATPTPTPAPAPAPTPAPALAPANLDDAAKAAPSDPRSPLARIAALPGVRWVGPYQPAFKSDPDLLRGYAVDATGKPLGPFDIAAARRRFAATWSPGVVSAMQRLATGSSESFWIQVLARGNTPDGAAMKQSVARLIEAIGGTIQNLTPDDNMMRAQLTSAQYLEVLHHPDVAFVDPWGPPGTDMDVERIVSGANALETANGMSGQGVRAEVMDAGFRQTHQGFTTTGPAPTIRSNSADTSHGSSTFGILFGDGTGNSLGRALLPNAAAKFFYCYSTLAGFGGSQSRLTATTGTVANEVVVQSNSWGSAPTTTYTTVSQAMDDIVFQTGLLICQSQSNNNSQSSRPEAWAKNVISVGGVFHRNNTNPLDDTSSGASFGPASDGRIKPDLAHHYDSVLTTTNTSDTAYVTDFGGTSAATPITAGYMGLVFQMWHGGIFPGRGGSSSVFASRPAFTTAKALAIHSAYRYNWTSVPANSTLTRARQGWGVINVNNLRLAAPTYFIEDETTQLRAGESKLYYFDVAPSTTQLRGTMVYRDPPGSVTSTIHRINDVSVRITGPSGTFWWGNNGLTASNVSTSGGVSNTIDTVENIFINSPAAGRYRLEVFADAVLQDGDPRTPGVGDVTYALVVSGGTRFIPSPCGLADLPVSGVTPDGVIDGSDFVAFINSFAIGDPLLDRLADVAGGGPDGLQPDGIIDGSDFVAFINAFALGC